MMKATRIDAITCLRQSHRSVDIIEQEGPPRGMFVEDMSRRGTHRSRNKGNVAIAAGMMIAAVELNTHA